MGGYGSLLTAERAATARGGDFFKGVAVSSQALWTGPDETAPGAFHSAQDFYSNDVFTGVASLRPLRVCLDWGVRPLLPGHTPAFSPHDVALRGVFPTGHSHQWLVALGGTGPDAVPSRRL
jgi:hypothetical protein